MTATAYTLQATTTLPFDQAIERAREELAAEGFGVLCEIDVAATLKKKINVDREPYVILGACNPSLANEALQAEPELGALLPCNVIVYLQDGTTHVSAIDADRMLSLVSNPELRPVAERVRDLLGGVISRIAQT